MNRSQMEWFGTLGVTIRRHLDRRLDTYLADAIYAVARLHEPAEVEGYMGCNECYDHTIGSPVWPCPTARALILGLGVTEEDIRCVPNR